MGRLASISFFLFLYFFSATAVQARTLDQLCYTTCVEGGRYASVCEQVCSVSDESKNPRKDADMQLRCYHACDLQKNGMWFCLNKCLVRK